MTLPRQEPPGDDGEPLMNIECPNCGFSGRVPGYVADAPHHARCPKCRFGFDIGDLAAAAPRPPGTLERAEAWIAPPSSSGGSSYEIKALVGAWEDEERPTAPPSPKPPPTASAEAAEPVADWRAGFGLVEWRVRLLEGWAVVLLVWAALIGSRVAHAALTRSDEIVFSQALFWPVAAVVLLVAAAAGLLLALELGRRLTNEQVADVKARVPDRREWLARPPKRVV